ncbi:MAG: hypothetical protein WBP41_02610 [Saprospiraceae bacterium]
MSKIVLTLLIIFAFTGNIISQETELDFTIGYQKHDKRFNADPEFVIDPGAWGTYYVSFNANKTIPVLDMLALKVGVGYAKEINTYSTPYDHCYFNKPGEGCPFIGANIDRYVIDLIRATIAPKIKFTKKLSLNFNTIPQFNFRKSVTGYGHRSGVMFELYSIEFNPELELAIGKTNIGLGYRLYQLKTIDPILLYGNNFLEKTPGYLDRNFDSYNPTKVIVTVGFDL